MSEGQNMRLQYKLLIVVKNEQNQNNNVQYYYYQQQTLTAPKHPNLHNKYPIETKVKWNQPLEANLHFTLLFQPCC